MGATVRGLETTQSAGEYVGCTWEHLGMPATSLGPPQITVEQSGKNIFFGNAAGGPGNHSYYLSFNDF